MEENVIYDVGMNNGDDAEYYLRKGYFVIGIDANKEMCDICTTRFSDAIEAGKLTILNTGVGQTNSSGTFYINRAETAISSFVAPRELGDAWTTRNVPIRTLSSIILEYGAPKYIKVDVEHYDAQVLVDLKENGICPPFISAEAHTRDIFEKIFDLGYRRFKLVEGVRVPELYKNIPIDLKNGEKISYSFPAYSSGPFGDDIPGDWVSAGELEDLIEGVGLGWIDIHAKLS